MLLVKLFNARLQTLHSLHLPELTDDQGVSEPSNNYRESNDRYA